MRDFIVWCFSVLICSFPLVNAIFLIKFIKEIHSLSFKVRMLCRVIENCNSLDMSVRKTFFEGEIEE